MTKILLGGILILFIISCDNDATLKSKEYPYLITENVIENDSTGATFSAKILDKGDEEIIDYGFFLRDDKVEYKISILNKSTLDDFHFKITTNLEKDKEYFYRAYIQTSRHDIQANEVTFISQGSTIPKIFSFSPSEGFDNTLVTIRGDGFGITKYNFKVLVHDIESEILLLSNDSIVFRTPKTSYSGDSKISIITGSKTVIADANYKILGPEIDSLSKREGHSGEYLTIWGKNLTQNGTNLDVNFGTFPSEIVTRSEKRVDIIIPIPLHIYSDLVVDNILPIQLINGLKVTTHTDSFILRKSWEKKQDPPFMTTGFENCFSFNNKGYFLDINYKKLMEYDPDLNIWSTISTYSGERNEYSHFTVFGDRFFKIGGANYLGKIYDFWEYNFITRIWLKRENTQFSFYQATSFVLENTLFIITDSRQVWAYNGLDNNFRRMNDFPDQIKLFLTYISQNKAYLVNYGQTWEYDILNDNWTRKSINPFHDSYYYDATIGFSLNGTCYVLQSGIDLYKFDKLNEKWILTSIYPYSGQGVYKSSFVIGDKAYIVALQSAHPDEYPLLFKYQE